MRPVILVFAKAPAAGQVKTRLNLTPADAMRLHLAFVSDTLQQLLRLGLADVELHTDTNTDAWMQFKVPQVLQSGPTLNDRMHYALTQALAQGRPFALLTGSDAPTIPDGHYEELMRPGADITLGPTEDGGYYAIGARRTHPQMFDGVTTSAADTLDQTLRALEACGLSTQLGPSWFDIDTPEDLARLIREPHLPHFTRAALAAI